MLFNQKLKRKKLVGIMQTFYNEYQNETDQNRKKELMKNLMLNLEKELNTKKISSDDRFYTYCRREFLRKEFTDKLNKENIKMNNDYLLDAYYNLYDYISNDTWISLSSIPNGISAQEVIKKDEEYKKSGVICLQEKEILLDMINELNQAIENYHELEIPIKNIENLEELIKKDIICPYCNSKEVWEYLYGEPTYDYDKDKYVLGGCEIDFSKKYKCKNCKKDFK